MEDSKNAQLVRGPLLVCNKLIWYYAIIFSWHYPFKLKLQQSIYLLLLVKIFFMSRSTPLCNLQFQQDF